MPVYVQLFNGEVLQFPDDTPREVVDRVAQQEVERLRPPEPAVQQAVPQPVAPRTERTWGEAFKDVGAGVVGGVGNVLAFPGQVAQLIPGLREAGQALSAPGEAVSRYAEDLKSEGLKIREALRSQAISDAEKDGMLSAFATAITTTLKDPALISTFLSEQVPLLLPPLAAARITQMAGRSSITAATRGLSGDAARVAAEEAAQQVNRRAYAAAVGTGAAMQGADISSGAYQRAYQAAIQQGMTPEEAADAATGAARIAGAGAFGTSLVTQRLPGARAIEERFARLPGTSGRIRAGVGEATSEGLEEAGGALFQNLGVRQVDPTVSLTEGVGAAAGLGVLGGGFFGTLLGKRGKESLAPGQREGESLEQTINRLSAERAQLMPQELEQQFPNAQQLIEMVNKNPEQGYSTIVKYIEQLKTQPDSPEKEQALQTAEEIRERLSVEDIERQIPSQKNFIPDKDLRKLGFSRQDPLYQELVGKDLANPADAKAVVDYLKAELQRENLPERRQTVVADMLTTVDQYLSTMPGSGFYVGEIDTAGVGAGAGVVQQPGRQPATAVGATERDGVAPAGEPVPKPVARTERQQPALVFETSKGSIYAVDADGKTSRTKRSPGRGQNETYPPHEAFYVSTSDADRLLDAMRTPEGRSIRLGYRDGNLFRSIQNRSEIPAGAQPFVAVLRKDTNQLVDFVSAELTPRLGLAPVEKLYTPDGMSSTHIGHPIVKIGKGRQAQVQNPVTEETLAQYGIKPASAVAKRILGKSQDDPKVQEELAKLNPQKPAEKPSEKPAGTTEEVDESLKLDGEAIFGTHKVAGLPIQYMLVKALKLSKDVPQFKSDADENGIVQKLSGKFDWRDLGPLQVWQRKNGDFEIISGRHRFDLAKSNNIQYLPVQIHKEADGFDVIQAKTLDAELNIRDGYGKVKDYVNYFQGTQLTREEAKSRGLLDRDPGKRGFDIANSGSPEIIAAHRANRITDQDAALVANAAPNDGRLQAIGLKVLEIDKKNGQTAVNTMKGVKAVLQDQGEQAGSVDMFGFDSSLMQEAEELAAIATRKQDEISRRISVLSGVTKNPKIAAQEGIDVKDPDAVKKRIADLRKQRSEWDRWETNPELIAEIKKERAEAAPAAPVTHTPASFAQDIVDRKDLNSAEDIQYYEKNAEAIEAELKKRPRSGELISAIARWQATLRGAGFVWLTQERRWVRADKEETPQEEGSPAPQDQMFSLRPEEMEARYRELEARAKREEPAQPATVTTPPDQRTEAIKARVAEIDKTLTDLLTRVMRKYGLNDVGLELVNDTKTNGQYSNRLIRLASDHLNPVLHLRHESIHALKDLGFFTPRQWDVLTEKARTEWLDTYLKKVPHKDNQSRYDAYLDMFKAEGMTDEQAQEALIEEAIADAFSYFQKAKPPAGLIASILNRINNFFKAIKEFLDVGNLTPDEIFGKIEAGELKPSVVPVKPNSWKANTAEKEKAESYEEQNGIKPYVSEGQITIPIEGENKKLSIKSPYRGRALTGYVKKRRDGTTEVVPPKFNDPLTGLPLNKDGTVTVYLPTTNEMAREIIRTKRIKAASPTANRIYLTNESSGKAILGNLGNIDSPVDGANMMLKLDPQLLHIDQEFPNGRKDFFLPIAEGEAFAQKAAMTKLFTMNLPRDKALSKDTKLTDLERRIEQSVQEYLTLSVPQQKARLEEAQEILKTAHNIGSLLTVNGKLEKTNTGGYGLNNYNGKDVMSMGLGMASAQRINEQKLSTCPNSAMCEGLCLGETSGQNELYGGEGQFRSGPRLAQYLKTEALVQHPEEFSVLLYDEIRRFQKAAVDEDYQPSVRLNVTSDFRPQVFKAIIDAFPGVEFYDYTKLPSNTIAPNHHLTYSSTGASQVVNGEVIVNPGSNWKKMVERMLQGQNVAMAFTSKTTMPDFVVDEATGERFQVWNGDNYDARFLDPKPGQPENLLNRGMIIGLTNKDRTTPPNQAAKKYKGFFMHYERSRDGDTLVVPDQDAFKKSKIIEIVPKLSIRAQTQITAPEEINVDGKMRSTFNSVGQPIHLTEEGVKNFWRWFGNSEMVDAQGRPIVVYHGGAKTFKEIKEKQGLFGGIFVRIGKPSNYRDVQFPLYLRGPVLDLATLRSLLEENETVLRNALPAETDANTIYKTIDALTDGGNFPLDEDVRNAIRAIDDADAQVEIQKLRGKVAKELGFEAVNTPDEFEGETVMVLGSSQIKSAADNIGTFSPIDPDIRKSLRAELTAAERDLRVRWADSRIEQLLSANAYLTDGREKDTKGFAAAIRPNDFLNATASEEDRQRIAAETGPLDPDRLAQYGQELYLEIKPTNEKGVYRIINHEGRHRMTALMNAGYNTPVPVVLKMQRFAAETEEKVYLEPQRFRMGDELVIAPRGIRVAKMIPINWEQRKELREVFGGEADLKFSLRSQTQTPAFKRWFGDSKVVDENGEPLVMYHGTSAKDDFSVFAKQSHFGTAVAANQRVKDRPNGPARVYPVFLSVQNPLRVSDVEASDEATLLNAIKRGKYKDIDLNTANQKGAVEALKEAGYDGLVYKNNMEDRGKDSWVAFSPTQIKSAIGNVGTFSPTEPDIRKSLRAKTSTPTGIPNNIWMQHIKTKKIASADFETMTSHQKSALTKSWKTLNKLVTDFTGSDQAAWELMARMNFISAIRDAIEDEDNRALEIYKVASPEEYAEEVGEINDLGIQKTSTSTGIPLQKTSTPIGIPNNIWMQHVKVKNIELSAYGTMTPQQKSAITKSWKTLNKLAKDFTGSDQAALDLMAKMNIISAIRDAIENEDASALEIYKVMSPEEYAQEVGAINDPDIRKSLRSPQQSLRNTLPANVWDRVDDTIGVRDQKSWPQRIMDAISPSNWSTFRENALNRYNELAVYDREYIRRNGGARLMADESAEAAALMSDLGAGLTAAAFGVNDRIGGVPVYRNGLVRIENMNGTVKGPLAIFAPLAQYKNPEVYRLYQFWATAQRGQRLNAEGKLTPFTPADMQAVRAIEAQYPEFRSIHNEWIKYNDGLVDFMKQAGVITPEMADAFRMHGDYFPMYKYMEDDVVTGPKTFTSIANVPIPKKFKGDDVNPMGDFFENVVRNTQAAIQAGIKNIAAQKATKVAMAIGQVRPLGYDRPGPNGTTVFVPAKPAKMLSTYYRVLENGEERYYAAADIKFINAIKALNIPDLPFIGFLAGPANVLRNLVTKTPDFMMANMLRDSLSAWATSGTNILPIVSTIRNFGKAIANKSPELDMLVRTGAVGGYDYSQGVEMSAKIFAQDLRKVAGARTTMENIARPATSVWEALEKGSAASDAATRMEVYKKVLDETGNEAEAVFRALEVMNFNRKGRSAIVRILTAAVPFLNARMQGLDVLYRAGIRPIFAKDATPYEQQIAKSFWVRGMTIMALSAMYWAMTHDDDEYKKQEQETRDNYWLIPSMGIKIPIPFEVGVMFKVIPERVLELSFGSDTGKDFVNSMARQLTSTFAFNPIPQTFLPIVEAATNYSFFTQRPIIGQGLENIAAPYQAAPTTSRTATGLADAYNAIIDGLPANVKAKIAASPMIVDQLIQGYTGSMGMYAVMAIDGVISANSDIPNATKRFEQMPVIRRFAIDPQARGTVTSFYDLKNSIDQVVRTANLLERTGKYDEYVKYVQENAGALSMRGYVNSLEKTMKEMREMKTRIRSSTIDADTKRDQLTAVQELENSLTSNIQTVKKTL